MSTIRTRQELEASETSSLQAFAVTSQASRGRKFKENFTDPRLNFERDRDRIIHAKAFRRLKDKTQVFVPHFGDHYRNRLSHSLEVAQVSRGLSRRMGLNEDLAESIALAHDLGHTPFGHAGESTLNECLQKFGLEFEHNEQSRRIVEELEEIYPDFNGLNLSIEVIEGMMKHQTIWDQPHDDLSYGIRPSLEAQIVNLADEIAYQNHDADDGIRSGLFDEEDLEKLEIWQMAAENVISHYGRMEDEHVRISRTVSAMVSLMIEDVIEESAKRLSENSILTLEDVYSCETRLIGFSPKILKANLALKDFLLFRMYQHPDVETWTKRGQAILKFLFEEMIRENRIKPEAIRDYLAGMTDRYAEAQALAKGFVSL